VGMPNAVAAKRRGTMFFIMILEGIGVPWMNAMLACKISGLINAGLEGLWRGESFASWVL
jgi:hypothetical protein